MPRGTHLEGWTRLGVVALNAHAEEELIALGSFEQGTEGSDMNFNVSFLSNEKKNTESKGLIFCFLYVAPKPILAGQCKFNNN